MSIQRIPNRNPETRSCPNDNAETDLSPLFGDPGDPRQPAEMTFDAGCKTSFPSPTLGMYILDCRTAPGIHSWAWPCVLP